MSIKLPDSVRALADKGREVMNKYGKGLGGGKGPGSSADLSRPIGMVPEYGSDQAPEFAPEEEFTAQPTGYADARGGDQYADIRSSSEGGNINFSPGLGAGMFLAVLAFVLLMVILAAFLVA